MSKSLKFVILLKNPYLLDHAQLRNACYSKNDILFSILALFNQTEMAEPFKHNMENLILFVQLANVFHIIVLIESVAVIDQKKGRDHI